MAHNLIHIVDFKWSLKELREKLIYKCLDIDLLYICVHTQKPKSIHNKNLVFLQLSEKYFILSISMCLWSFFFFFNANSHDIFPLWSDEAQGIKNPTRKIIPRLWRQNVLGNRLISLGRLASGRVSQIRHSNDMIYSQSSHNISGQ